MAIDFYEDALPALIAMAEFEPKDWTDRFLLKVFLRDELGQSEEKIAQVSRHLAGDGLIEPHGGFAWTGDRQQLASAQITANGLKMLDLWPTEDNELKYIVAQIVEALHGIADDSTDEKASKLRAAAGAIKDVGVEVVASVISKQVTGG